jgi:hypothetical protein
MLKGILKAEMEAPPRGLGINVKAQRVKGIFNLLNAATIRRNSSLPPKTASFI